MLLCRFVDQDLSIVSQDSGLLDLLSNQRRLVDFCVIHIALLLCHRVTSCSLLARKDLVHLRADRSDAKLSKLR